MKLIQTIPSLFISLRMIYSCSLLTSSILWLAFALSRPYFFSRFKASSGSDVARRVASRAFSLRYSSSSILRSSSLKRLRKSSIFFLAEIALYCELVLFYCTVFLVLPLLLVGSDCLVLLTLLLSIGLPISLPLSTDYTLTALLL